MADTILKYCERCNEPFDFLPQAGMPSQCDDCEEAEQRYFAERESLLAKTYFPTLADDINKVFKAYKKLTNLMDNIYENNSTNSNSSIRLPRS